MKSRPIGGPVTSIELREVGITNVEKLKSLGWRQAWLRLIQYYPHRLNVNMGYGLYAAEHGIHWLDIPEAAKFEIQSFVVRRRPKKAARRAKR